MVKAAESYMGEFGSAVSGQAAHEAVGQLSKHLIETLEPMQDARVLLMEAFLVKAIQKFQSLSEEDEKAKAEVAGVIRRQRSDLTSSYWKLDRSLVEPTLLSLTDACLEPESK